MSWLNWYWPIMLLFVLPVLLFGVPEFFALKFGGETFSRFMAKMGGSGGFFHKLWFLAWGVLIGGLLVHFNGWCVLPDLSSFGIMQWRGQ